jgi:hypothetical protein
MDDAKALEAVKLMLLAAKETHLGGKCPKDCPWTKKTCCFECDAILDVMEAFGAIEPGIREGWRK